MFVAPRRCWSHLRLAWLAGTFLLALCPATRPALAAAEPPIALIVGGGPDVDSNAAQIEGHTRFVASLVPDAARRTVLFADGKAAEPSVTCADTSVEADAERALAVILANHDAEFPVLARPPRLGVPVEGPARLAEFRRALTKAASAAARQAGTPLLLYFAGHGTQDEEHEQNTRYDLWHDEKLSVRELSDQIARLPRQVPVVLVMAQCFSGAFANVLSAHGDPTGAAVERPGSVVGFFSARKDREAAGCSYATGRADYQDFSSYFFGALSGRDRFSDPVEGADYDGDGTVSLHEAFCYALIHDPSADTPVCTSDAFLLREAWLPYETIYGTSYPEAWQAASPAQRAVLDALSTELGLSGDARVLGVYDRLTYGDPSTSPALLARQEEAKGGLREVRQHWLGPLFEGHPVLRWGEQKKEDYQKAFAQAAEELVRDEGKRGGLLAADKAREQAEEAADHEEAALLRFASVYAHVVAAKELRAHGTLDAKAHFERLWNAEQSTLTLRHRE